MVWEGQAGCCEKGPEAQLGDQHSHPGKRNGGEIHAPGKHWLQVLTGPVDASAPPLLPGGVKA